ncbi:MAG: hypothetical protein QOK37_4733 [Thermoanaerobaculia bacterium]|nr:hypothetical protein [Thermoanaerobaculia bacterium]
MSLQSPRSLSAEVLVILIAALAAGILEAALIATHRIAGVDPFNYVPLRIWLIVPLVWIAIAGVLAVPAYVLSRRQGMRIVLSAITALLVGCRIALVSRKWGLVALFAVFLALFWILRRIRIPELRSAGVWLTALVVIGACGAGVAIPRPALRPAVPATAGPNLLIIVADTVRRDAVFRPDGSVKPGLPSLQRFASESTIFDAAYAASSWTLPSHFSAMTGLESYELGLDFDHQTFRKPELMLAERFRRKGYRTAAVIANPFLHERSGFARGFDSYDHAGRALDLCRTAPLTILAQLAPRFAGTVCGWSATQVTERALQHMNDDAAPYLVFLNFMDAHEPSYVEPQCRAGVPARHNTFLRLQVREAPLYHAAIRCLDRSLGVLSDRADASSRGTVVVFLSDHGEHLGEGGAHRTWPNAVSPTAARAADDSDARSHSSTRWCSGLPHNATVTPDFRNVSDGTGAGRHLHADSFRRARKKADDLRHSRPMAANHRGAEDRGTDQPANGRAGGGFTSPSTASRRYSCSAAFLASPAGD